MVETTVLGKVKNIEENSFLSMKDYKKYLKWMELNNDSSDNNQPSFEHPKRSERVKLIGDGVFMSIFIVKNSIHYLEGADNDGNTNISLNDESRSKSSKNKRDTREDIEKRERKEKNKISPLTKACNIQILVDAHCPFLIPSVKLWDKLTVDDYHILENYFNIITERQRYKSATIETALNQLNTKMCIKNNPIQIYPDIISRSQTLRSHQIFMCYDYEDLKSENFDNAIKDYKWVDLAEFEEALLRTYVPTRYIQVTPTYVDNESNYNHSTNHLHSLSSRASLLPFIYPTKILYWILCDYPPPYYSLITSKQLTESILFDVLPSSLVSLEKMMNTVQMQGSDISRKILYCLCKNVSGQRCISLLEELDEETKKYRAPMTETLKKQGIIAVDSNMLLKNYENGKIPEKISTRTKILQALIWITCGIDYIPGELTSEGILERNNKTFDTRPLEMFIEKCEKAMLPLSLDLFNCFQKRNVNTDLVFDKSLPCANVNYEGIVEETKSELGVEGSRDERDKVHDNKKNKEETQNTTTEEYLFDNIEIFARSIVNECIYNAYDESKKMKAVIAVAETIDRIVEIVEATQYLVDVTVFNTSKIHVNKLLQKEETEIRKNKEKLINEATPKTIQIALDALDGNGTLSGDSENGNNSELPITVSPIFMGSQIENTPASVELSPGRLPLLCDVPTPFTLAIRNLSYLFGDIICSIDSILESLDGVQIMEDEVERFRSISRVVHMKSRVVEAKQMAINLARERRQRESQSLSEKVASMISSSEMPIITISLDKILEDSNETDEAEISRKGQNGNNNTNRGSLKINKINTKSFLYESKVRKMRKLMNQDRITKE